MIELATISLTVFSYVTEENERIVEALYNVLGEELRSEKLTKISSTSQFGDPFVIYNYETDNSSLIETVLKNISNKLDNRSKNYLHKKLEEKIDLESRTIYMRFNKYKAYQGDVIITEGGDVIKLEISYNAYTKKDNSFSSVRELLRIFELLVEE